jgi:hypothetical protein
MKGQQSFGGRGALAGNSNRQQSSGGSTWRLHFFNRHAMVRGTMCTLERNPETLPFWDGGGRFGDLLGPPRPLLSEVT